MILLSLHLKLIPFQEVFSTLSLFQIFMYLAVIHVQDPPVHSRKGSKEVSGIQSPFQATHEWWRSCVSGISSSHSSYTSINSNTFLSKEAIFNTMYSLTHVHLITRHNLYTYLLAVRIPPIFIFKKNDTIMYLLITYAHKFLPNDSKLAAGEITHA